jgi:hypothetical protein
MRLRYFPRRAPRKLDISLLLKVCPNCLGDLVFRSDFSGDYYRCLQCNERAGLAHADRLTGVRATLPLDARHSANLPPAAIG